MGLFSRKKTRTKDTAKPSPAARSVRAKTDAGTAMKDLYAKKAPAPAGAKEEAAKNPNRPAVAYRVLLAPLVTEKATNLGSENKYVFRVARTANKIMVGRSIEEVYGVKPVSVRIINVRGKQVRYGRVRGQRKAWKKAIVELPAGKTINIYEGV